MANKTIGLIPATGGVNASLSAEAGGDAAAGAVMTIIFDDTLSRSDVYQLLRQTADLVLSASSTFEP